MVKFLLSVLLLIGLSGCGVETSSSAPITGVTDGSDTNDTTDGSDTDDNTTDTDDETPTGGGVGTSNIFDATSATFDEKACLIDATYSIAFKDSSFDPLATERVDLGLEIGSQFDYATLVEDTEVTIFVPTLNQSLMGSRTVVYGDKYWFGFDEAWVYNDNKTIYIRTPKLGTNFYGCYRYELSSTTAASITETKVYR